MGTYKALKSFYFIRSHLFQYVLSGRKRDKFLVSSGVTRSAYPHEKCYRNNTTSSVVPKGGNGEPFMLEPRATLLYISKLPVTKKD